jgi:ABC-type lipoprotein export system ATPase subunit
VLVVPQDADVYLLDDVLAAVDSHVSASLVQTVICGPVLGGKTRVVVTHSPACKARADMLIRMYGGKVDYSGPPEGDTVNVVDVSILPPIRTRTSAPPNKVYLNHLPRHENLVRKIN